MEPTPRKYAAHKVLRNVEVVDIAVKGKSIARRGDLVILLDGGVPGDVVDVKIRRKRRNYWEGYPIAFRRYSDRRVDPFCTHFGVCGGCKWQNIAYEHQLRFKEKIVRDNFQRIGGLEGFTPLPIVPSPQQRAYRNKMEFSFTRRRWLSPEEVASGRPIEDRRGLGLHFSGRFDWIVHLEECHLEPPYHNVLRQRIFERARQLDIPFYDPIHNMPGLRSLVLRCNLDDEWMVLLVGSEPPSEAVGTLLDEVAADPKVHSVYYAVNDRRNDALAHVELIHWAGDPLLPQPMGRHTYYIGPLSFFQPNTRQAMNLYDRVRDFVPPDTETLLDAYCGTGTIGLWVADKVKRVVGVETVEEAVRMAHYNARKNGVAHAEFYHLSVDEMETLAEADYDVVVVDPPRAGLSARMLRFLDRNRPRRIIYVSCNPSTQARDVAALRAHYRIVHAEPFDMFPHTPHVENLVVLDRDDD